MQASSVQLQRKCHQSDTTASANSTLLLHKNIRRPTQTTAASRSRAGQAKVYQLFAPIPTSPFPSGCRRPPVWEAKTSERKASSGLAAIFSSERGFFWQKMTVLVNRKFCGENVCFPWNFSGFEQKIKIPVLTKCVEEKFPWKPFSFDFHPKVSTTTSPPPACLFNQL